MGVLVTPGQLDQPTDLAGELGVPLRVGALCPPHRIRAHRLRRAAEPAFHSHKERENYKPREMKDQVRPIVKDQAESDKDLVIGHLTGKDIRPHLQADSHRVAVLRSEGLIRDSFSGPAVAGCRRSRNSALLRIPRWPSARVGDYALAEQGEAGAAVHLAFEHLDLDMLTVPSTLPELQGRVRPLVTACWSVRIPAAKDFSSGRSPVSTVVSQFSRSSWPLRRVIICAKLVTWAARVSRCGHRARIAASWACSSPADDGRDAVTDCYLDVNVNRRSARPGN